ncbi:integrase [Erythrobacter sp. QSSC1-22B]|uniref:tyrosine-type recombinase/integrase n=1 Tax=Erythrobacter sp. QSSC1-22B TaxID=1860125 RepID=UPI000805BD6E|nr:integrase family protein [Erythrobacter sp. QSSC1-22B]OBX19778.1 integrase [Erythrobacter sp. QSSC1-22B]
MATGKISKRTVDALHPSKTNQFLWDAGLKGFGAKITPAGAISYVLQFRMGGREASTRRYTIGPHGSPWTPTTARLEAERLLILIAQGVDPVDADRKRRREAVDLAFDNYASHFARSCKGEGWSRIVERVIRLHLKPVLRGKPLPSIVRADIVAVLDQMPVDQIANRRNVFAVMRRLFRWAVSRGDLDRSPMEGMETPPPVRPRDRWLTDEELRLIWKATPQCRPCFGPIVRLLITTGQRREEVSGMDWLELDRTERFWTLPGSRTKNGEPNSIPLNELAIAELDKQAGATTWPRKGRIFATRSGAGFSGYAKGKLKLDGLVRGAEGEPLPPWRLHDLRRTVATNFQRLGVRFEVTEAVLNHVSGSRAGVAGVYQRHDWKEEKIQALNDWNNHLKKLLPRGHLYL